MLMAGWAVSARVAEAQAKRAGGAKSAKKPQPPAKPKPKEFSDELVAEAIRKGVAYLKGIQKPDGSWEPFGSPGAGYFYPIGPSAMVTYALLESGLCRHDHPEMKKALGFLGKWEAPPSLASATPKNFDDGYKKNWEKYCHMTYSLGLRANAWLAAAKQGASEYIPHLRRDVKQLVRSTKDGSYNYYSFGQMRSSGDNSNSQYGVLGVWAGAQLDEEVPRGYWYVVLKHWLECVNQDGGWTYSGRSPSTPTMTTAGLATLFVCYDNLLADGFVKCDQGEKVQAVLKPLTAALDWVDRYYQQTGGGVSAGSGHGGRGYYLLYGIERVGLASGYKYFGKADWYKLGATWLINHQNADGSWPGGYGPAISTSYALLFLIRGRHAVLFNKLEFNGDWNNRPRDLAGLCRWTSKEFETTVNWQIVNLRVPPEEWHDAPILYMSASRAPNFTAKEIEALRTYVYQGGTILSCTECSGSGYSKAARDLFAKMFPAYRLVESPKDHRLYSINFKLEGFPEFRIVTNGIRPLVVHTDKDLPRSWQLRLTQTDRISFQAAANVAMYVTGKALADRALAARGTTIWPAEVQDFKPARSVKVARLRYSTTGGKPGNYDPEPLAWQRFSRLMARQADTEVQVAGPMPISELAASGAKVATIAGTDRIAVSDGEIQALQQFVKDGGLLLVEAAGGAWAKGGARAFDESAEVLARQIASGLPDDSVPRKRLRRLTLDSPLYQQKGFEIKEAGFRRFSRVDVGVKDRAPLIKGLLDANDRVLVLVSGEDLTTALVGYTCDEVHGYTPSTAFALMRNIVLSKAKALAKSAPRK
jgi:hypothetical protein